MPPGIYHKAALKKKLAELKQEGYLVIDTQGKIPDAIAVKDGKIYAVEMMGQRWTKNKKWNCRLTKRMKKISYNMYDGMIYETFRYPKRN